MHESSQLAESTVPSLHLPLQPFRTTLYAYQIVASTERYWRNLSSKSQATVEKVAKSHQVSR
jgi:hypothetical protein